MAYERKTRMRMIIWSFIKYSSVFTSLEVKDRRKGKLTKALFLVLSKITGSSGYNNSVRVVTNFLLSGEIVHAFALSSHGIMKRKKCSSILNG